MNFISKGKEFYETEDLRIRKSIFADRPVKYKKYMKILFCLLSLYYLGTGFDFDDDLFFEIG